MALRLTWRPGRGLTLEESARIGRRGRIWAAIPLTRRNKRKTRRGASFRL